MSFEELSAVDALEVSIDAAEHLEVKHAATVAAARQLAIRVDELNDAGWVIDGKLDNVTLPVFLKYCEALGLTVDKVPAKRGPKPKEDEPKPSPIGSERESRARAMLSLVGGKAG